MQRKFVALFLSFQLVFLGVIALDWVGLRIPLLRQVISFMYLTFIPGLLLLYILNVDLNRIEGFLYAVGSSLGLLMLIGLFVNVLYPYLGVSKPITEIPLVATITAVTTILFIIGYIQGKPSFSHFPSAKQFAQSLNLKLSLSISLLIMLAVLGSVFFNRYDQNLLLLILFAIISIVPLVTVSYQPSNKEVVFPLIIWAVALSLLIHNALITPYLRLGDSCVEYYFANIVKASGIWNPTYEANKNAMLRLVILHPLYSIVGNIDLEWSFRVVHPLLFSLAPVTLYQVFRKQTFRDFAFLASFLFMFAGVFFHNLSLNTRTGTAMFFLALIVLLISDRKLPRKAASLLYIIFVFSLITSHYGVAYVFLYSTVLSFILIILFKRFNLSNYLFFTTSSLTCLSLVLLLTWYTYTASSHLFDFFIRLGMHIVASIKDIFTPSGELNSLVRREMPSISMVIIKYMYFVIAGLVSVGFINTVIDKFMRKKKSDFSDEYLIYSLTFAIIGFIMFLPMVGVGLMRYYGILIILLAPFCVLGFVRIVKILEQGLKCDLKSGIMLKSFALFLAAFLLFGSGFISATVTKDRPPYPLIDKERILESGTVREKYALGWQYVSESGYHTSNWLISNRVEGKNIYESRMVGPFISSYLLTEKFYGKPPIPIHIVEEDTVRKEGRGYIVLGMFGVQTNLMSAAQKGNRSYDKAKFVDVSNFKESTDKIYHSKWSRIYQFEKD